MREALVFSPPKPLTPVRFGADFEQLDGRLQLILSHTLDILEWNFFIHNFCTSQAYFNLVKYIIFGQNSFKRNKIFSCMK